MALFGYDTHKIKLDRITSDLVWIKYQLAKTDLVKEEIDDLQHLLLDIHELARSTTEMLNKKTPKLALAPEDFLEFIRSLQKHNLHKSEQDPLSPTNPQPICQNPTTDHAGESPDANTNSH